MTERKWTRGPWDFDEGDFTIYQMETSDEIASIETVSWHPEITTRANAHLIAAAPELYEALESIANWLAEPRLAQWHYVENGLLHEDAAKFEASARAALAKARGET